MKASSKVIAFLVPIVMLLLADSALAGESGEVSCTTAGCGYHLNLKIGGGKLTPALTGYCPAEKKFVSIKLGSWDEYRQPQYCPGRREHLQPIYDGADVARIPCPICGKMTLKYQRGLFFD
jgi:hypothetical protein